MQTFKVIFTNVDVTTVVLVDIDDDLLIALAKSKMNVPSTFFNDMTVTVRHTANFDMS